MTRTFGPQAVDAERLDEENLLAVRTRLIEYSDASTTYEGLLAWDDRSSASRPGVLVAHTIRGRTAFEDDKARDLAKLGYAAFSLDVYGKKELLTDDINTRAQMDTLKEDRVELQNRLSLSLNILRDQAEVDGNKLAAIGFCFGGLCVLDLARIGEKLAGVVSFHGLFQPPGNTEGNSVNAGVLVLHGWDDPLATPDAVVALGEEMTRLGADWQIHGYGNTVHAFTNPTANDTDRGTVYHALADQRSWIAMQNFLVEKFD